MWPGLLNMSHFSYQSPAHPCLAALISPLFLCSPQGGVSACEVDQFWFLSSPGGRCRRGSLKYQTVNVLICSRMGCPEQHVGEALISLCLGTWRFRCSTSMSAREWVILNLGVCEESCAIFSG